MASELRGWGAAERPSRLHKPLPCCGSRTLPIRAAARGPPPSDNGPCGAQQPPERATHPQNPPPNTVLTNHLPPHETFLTGLLLFLWGCRGHGFLTGQYGSSDQFLRGSGAGSGPATKGDTVSSTQRSAYANSTRGSSSPVWQEHPHRAQDTATSNPFQGRQSPWLPYRPAAAWPRKYSFPKQVHPLKAIFPGWLQRKKSERYAPAGVEASKQLCDLPAGQGSGLQEQRTVPCRQPARGHDFSPTLSRL